MRMIVYYGSWALLILALLAGIYNAAALYRLERDNQLITRLNNDQDTAVERSRLASPPVKLAYAAYLKRHQRYDDALAVLSRMMGQGDESIRLASRYNLGNIYLSQAIDYATELRFDEAMALTGLAKNAYRKALSINSRYWDAKYNLEVAMRLLPEMERINVEDEQENEKKGKPWTTIPGFPRGLP
ncbi:MxaK protein [Methylomarinum sp. Ch1-1]|uniref:MxaK protein n=1 Tax=Methylomarinum roseum TaxID=3067653 RepID=A0AAU7NYU2_9GAMM|nr:MxaK protein [Methylomarinum sp. Ch1-1]MDP4521719.1 MxaK protein [Methylomarinum sp. Ch1-1]